MGEVLSGVHLPEVIAALEGARDALSLLRAGASSVQTVDLSELTGLVSTLAREAAGARVALVAQAQERDVPRDSGHRDVVTWLSSADPRLDTTDARQVARLLSQTELPALHPLRAAAENGEISARTAIDVSRLVERLRHVVCARSGADAVDPAEAAQRVEHLVDDALTLHRAGCSPQQVRRFELELMTRYAPSRLAIDEAATVERATMSAFRRTVDGMYEATVVLDETSMLVVRSAIDALSAPRPSADGAIDPRPAGRRRADALVLLAESAAGLDTRGPMGATTRLLLTTTLTDLLGRAPAEPAATGTVATCEATSDAVESSAVPAGVPASQRWADTRRRGDTGLGETFTGETVTPRALRALVCDAQVVPVVVGAPSQPLDVGRRQRLATAAQRDALTVRDRGCTFPDCTAPPGWTRAHHLTHWAHGGATDLDNLTLLCSMHHRYVHQHDIQGAVHVDGMRWDVHRNAAGRWVPTSPRAA